MVVPNDPQNIDNANDLQVRTTRSLRANIAVAMYVGA